MISQGVEMKGLVRRGDQHPVAMHGQDDSLSNPDETISQNAAGAGGWGVSDPLSGCERCHVLLWYVVSTAVHIPATASVRAAVQKLHRQTAGVLGATG